MKISAPSQEVPIENFDIDIPDLPALVDTLLQQIPHGRVCTYGTLADALGSRSASRWVGEYLMHHPHSDECQCHRVVRSSGEIGLYVSGCPSDKLDLLASESVIVRNGRVDLDRFGYHELESDQPLARMIEWQQRIAQQVKQSGLRKLPRIVAGVDVSYASSEEAVAAYALVQTKSGECIGSVIVRSPVRFPYIPGFLTFRELPVLLKLVEEAEARGLFADVLLVDGNGQLHPRGAGIATCLGVVRSKPTVGVGKKLLCGQLQEQCDSAGNREVVYQGKVVGIQMQAKERLRPLFVSPGHLVSVGRAAAIVKNTFHGHRLPEPVFLADSLSRRGARSGGNLPFEQ